MEYNKPSSGHRPRLNMAIPSPASDRMEMDPRTIAGIVKFHLQQRQRDKRVRIVINGDHSFAGLVSEGGGAYGRT